MADFFDDWESFTGSTPSTPESDEAGYDDYDATSYDTNYDNSYANTSYDSNNYVDNNASYDTGDSATFSANTPSDTASQVSASTPSADYAQNTASSGEEEMQVEEEEIDYAKKLKKCKPALILAIIGFVLYAGLIAVNAFLSSTVVSYIALVPLVLVAVSGFMLIGAHETASEKKIMGMYGASVLLCALAFIYLNIVGMILALVLSIMALKAAKSSKAQPSSFSIVGKLGLASSIFCCITMGVLFAIAGMFNKTGYIIKSIIGAIYNFVFILYLSLGVIVANNESKYLARKILEKEDPSAAEADEEEETPKKEKKSKKNKKSSDDEDIPAVVGEDTEEPIEDNEVSEEVAPSEEDKPSEEETPSEDVVEEVVEEKAETPVEETPAPTPVTPTPAAPTPIAPKVVAPTPVPVPKPVATPVEKTEPSEAESGTFDDDGSFVL